LVRTAFAIGVCAFAGVFGSTAQAVVNGHLNVMNTTVPPDDYVPPAPITDPWPAVPDWDQGDPGWDNVTTAGSSFVYLGDNWVLTARHVGIPLTVTFSSGTFTRIGSQTVTIRNPPPSLANGASLTTETDLRLFRVSGNVGLPALTIASESPPLTGAAGSEVMFIGRGRIRQANETHWNSSWVPGGGSFHGYDTCSGPAGSVCPLEKRWGTNRLENPNGSQYPAASFDEAISNTTAVLPLTTLGDGVTRDIISMVTDFNKPGTTGALPFESQAVSSDSGGAVFYNRGTEEVPDWVLTGIVNATIIYNSQPSVYAVYGNSTTFADLSYYNQPYKTSICDIMKACGAYSLIGDVNLDGAVTGDGTGDISEDDVAAFVAGWGNDNRAGRGDYETWIKGDMNLDGLTDVDDFLLLRGALHGPINSEVMMSLFGGAVPEPSSAALALLNAAFLAAKARRRGKR